jgi:hypothetical protein
MNIIASPQRVCAEHAVEFWTGLLAYSHARAGVCIKNDQQCSCLRCREMAADFSKAAAAKRVDASTGDHAEFAIKRAS